MSKDLPSPELLRKLLRYEPETGKLYWRERTSDMFKDGPLGRNNSCHCKEAFTTSLTHGHKTSSIFSKRYQAHRVIWAMVYGEWPEGEIDHINGVSDDNKTNNLRQVTHAENAKNQKKRIDNTSGNVGVSYHKKIHRWVAYITVDFKRINLGSFSKKAEAIRARIDAESKYNFHANHGRR